MQAVTLALSAVPAMAALRLGCCSQRRQTPRTPHASCVEFAPLPVRLQRLSQ